MVTLEEARKNKLCIDWEKTKIDKPNFIGVKEITNYTISDLRKYIDWTFFFIGWGMKKLYPDILEDEKYGEEAKKLFDDANKDVYKRQT